MYDRLYRIQTESHDFRMGVAHLRLFAFCPDMLGEQAARWFGEVCGGGHRLFRPRRPFWSCGEVWQCAAEQQMTPA